jgi:RNA polymerase sigma-70 factor (ECF subfamily)
MSPEDTTSDEELVRRFLSDRAAASFEALYDRHSPYLFRVALRMLRGDQAAAEDALQEAWIRAVTSLSRFRGESSLRTWLCGITMNCCREAWRRRPVQPIDELPEMSGASPSESAHLDAIRLEQALGRLDDSSREIIELFDVLGHTHEEVSRILGIAPGTSKSRLFRARETLRRLLGTDGRRAAKRSTA